MKGFFGAHPTIQVCIPRWISIGLLLVGVSLKGSAAELKAEYQFRSNLVSSVLGAPDLVPVDPFGTNHFNQDIVNGVNQTVYTWAGVAAPVALQAGFTLDTTGLVATNSYSVQMIFKLTERQSAWRRLIDVENRQSDDGFYVDPGNHLAVFPIISSVTPFTNNIYEDVMLAVGNGTVTAYLNGILQFNGASTLMNINLNNQGNKLGFFIDNVVGGGQQEFANGSIALLRLFSGVAQPTVALNIATTTTNSVLVYWPAAATGWRLQYNTNLSTANWSNYVDAVTDDGISRSAVITSPSSSKFFRLVTP